ncbi:hypothetical protein FOA52_001092 [Chlamydomonas sp. UWO 241]|nr:hypothetical protein FOA52_001092 [Chlamydomonas sp. UWO 241]
MATIDVSDCCLVCADPLEWAGVGICGHKEICSRCVARMRFILKDNACVLCKTESPSMFVTRFMGDYTARVAPADFPLLKARAARGELHHLPDIDAYFDDKAHCAEIAALCGYTHPVLARGTAPPPTFRNLGDMKRHIEKEHKQSFCDICVRSRQVFVCEQLLYTRESLNRHNAEGDETGPMAEAGFKGHPQCKFCRQRFYDSQELWRHMESDHEHCFLCRRRDPSKYVYYRHYRELEDHFQGDHHMCPHPRCIEKHFVVFPEEHELKRHIATEHGEEMNMSKAQRRELNTLAIPLMYNQGSSYDAEAVEQARIAERLNAPGVTIGGGEGVRARIAPRPQGGGGGGGGGGMHHSRSDSNMPAGPDSHLDSVTLHASEFPTLGGTAGDWASSSAAGGSGSAQQPSSYGGAALTNDDHFPSLPSMSRQQKKELVQANLRVRHANLAARFAQPSVLHRAVQPSVQGITPAALVRPATGVPGASDFPALMSSTSSAAVIGASYGGTGASYGSGPAPRPASSILFRGPGSAGMAAAAAPPAAAAAAPAAGHCVLPGGTAAAAAAGPAGTGPPPKVADKKEFPSLGRAGPPPAAFVPSGGASSSAAARFAALAAAPAHRAAFIPAPASAAAVALPPPQAPPSAGDFPSLPVNWSKGSNPKKQGGPGGGSKSARAAPLPAAAAEMLGLAGGDSYSGFETATAPGGGAGGDQGSAAGAGANASRGRGGPAPSGAEDKAMASEALAAKWAAAEAAAQAREVSAKAFSSEQLTAAAAPAAPKPSDFPSLGQVTVAGRNNNAAPGGSGNGGGKKGGKGSGGTSTVAPVVVAPARAAPAGTAAGASAMAVDGVSEALKTANRALIEKVRTQLADDALFAQFRSDSVDFQRGTISANIYHEHMVAIGLLPLVAELAALCPDADKRGAIMGAHLEFLSSGGASAPGGAGGRGWMPPEAAAAAAVRAAAEQCWACPTCSLINAPRGEACEACGTPQPGLEEDAFPSLGGLGLGGGGAGSSGQQQQGGGKKGKKGKGTVMAMGAPQRGTGHLYVAPAADAAPASVWGGSSGGGGGNGRSNGAGGGSNVPAASAAMKRRVEAERANLSSHANTRSDAGWN